MRPFLRPFIWCLGCLCASRTRLVIDFYRDVLASHDVEVDGEASLDELRAKSLELPALEALSADDLVRLEADTVWLWRLFGAWLIPYTTLLPSALTALFLCLVAPDDWQSSGQLVPFLLLALWVYLGLVFVFSVLGGHLFTWFRRLLPLGDMLVLVWQDSQDVPNAWRRAKSAIVLLHFYVMGILFLLAWLLPGRSLFHLGALVCFLFYFGMMNFLVPKGKPRGKRAIEPPAPATSEEASSGPEVG